jgi:hypothetical protein
MKQYKEIKMRVVTTYDEVKLSGSKAGICPACGKRAQRSYTVSQTINPFNKNKEGQYKNYSEIMEENHKELRIWEEKPIYHAKCE